MLQVNKLLLSRYSHSNNFKVATAAYSQQAGRKSVAPAASETYTLGCSCCWLLTTPRNGDLNFLYPVDGESTGLSIDLLEKASLRPTVPCLLARSH